MTVDVFDAVDRLLQHVVRRLRRFEEIQLCLRLEQPVHRHRHRPDRDPSRHRKTQPAAGALPELPVQSRRRKCHAARRGGGVGVFDFHHHPPGGEPSPPEPPALRFSEPAQQRVQDAEIVGIGGEGMGQAVFRLHFRRQHRPRVDSPALRPKQPAPRAEHGAELALGDLGHLADSLELIFVEPEQDVLGNAGKQRHQMRRQELRLSAAGNQHGPWGLSIPPNRPTAQPPDTRRRFRDQLVHRGAHRQRETEALAGLTSDPFRDVHQRTEEPFGAGEIEKGVAVAARLDDRRIDPKDLMQRAGGASVEPGIGRKQHEVGTELLRLAHQHSPSDSRRLCLRRKGEHNGAIGARRSDGERPAPERRCHHSLDGSDEGGWVDEENRAYHGCGER